MRSVSLLVRPEDVHVFPGRREGPNRLLGSVDFIRDIGASIEIIVRCGDHKLIAMMTPKERPAVTVGDDATVECPPEACLVLQA